MAGENSGHFFRTCARAPSFILFSLQQDAAKQTERPTTARMLHGVHAMPRLSHSDWPARLWIVRHGQSAGTVARDAAEAKGLELIDLVTRDADAPLSELGQEQAT